MEAWAARVFQSVEDNAKALGEVAILSTLIEVLDEREGNE